MFQVWIYHAHLHEPHHTRERVGNQVFTKLGPFADADPPQRRWRPHLRMLHEETGTAPIAAEAVGTADQGQGTTRHLRHDPAGDLLVVAGELDLGDARFGEDDAIGMRDLDAGHARHAWRYSFPGPSSAITVSKHAGQMPWLNCASEWSAMYVSTACQ